VPFRLTRMLTFAMEVSNIEGSFRTTCEHVMRLLRGNKESLMAVLEAFIHDPLLNWRLGNRESPPETSFPSDRRASVMAAGGPTEGRRPSVMGGDPNAPSERPASSYRPRHRLSVQQMNGNADPVEREVQNARALQVLSRVKEKLTGRDFKKEIELPVDEQVEKLLSEATNLENLCQHYIGVSLRSHGYPGTMLTLNVVVFILVDYRCIFPAQHILQRGVFVVRRVTALFIQRRLWRYEVTEHESRRREWFGGWSS